MLKRLRENLLAFSFEADSAAVLELAATAARIKVAHAARAGRMSRDQVTRTSIEVGTAFPDFRSPQRRRGS